MTALVAISKQDGGMRLIHDASLLLDMALHDYATKDPCQYQTVQDALHHIQPGWYMAKVDLKAAYRSVGIARTDRPLTGLKWCFEDRTP